MVQADMLLHPGPHRYLHRLRHTEEPTAHRLTSTTRSQPVRITWPRSTRAGQLTYAQLADQVDVAAYALDAAGIGPGEIYWHSTTQLERMVDYTLGRPAGRSAITNPLIPIYARIVNRLHGR